MSRRRRTTSPTTSSATRCTSPTCKATLLHCLGIDHERLTFRYQGRQHRLTDADGRAVPELLAGARGR